VILRRLLIAALAIGVAIDGSVAALGLFAPQLLTPLLDIPVRDPVAITIGSGEFAVAALVYALCIRDLDRFAPFLWLCALDQLFAVVLPALAIVHGDIPGTWKTIAPIPFQAALMVLFATGALRLKRPR
jgi:hypothetical protein